MRVSRNYSNSTSNLAIDARGFDRGLRYRRAPSGPNSLRMTERVKDEGALNRSPRGDTTSTGRRMRHAGVLNDQKGDIFDEPTQLTRRECTQLVDNAPNDVHGHHSARRKEGREDNENSRHLERKVMLHQGDDRIQNPHESNEDNDFNRRMDDRIPLTSFALQYPDRIVLH